MNQANNFVPEHSPSIKIGDKQTVPHDMIVFIQNPEGVENSNCSFEFNDDCYIHRGGIVKVVGTHGKSVLVRYQATRKGGGTCCPTGAIFFLDIDIFSMMTEEYEQVISDKEDALMLVKRLLSEEREAKSN